MRFAAPISYIPHGLLEAIAEEYRTAGSPTTPKPMSSLVFQDPIVAAGAAALVRAIDKGVPDLYAESATRWLATHLLSQHSPRRSAFDRPRAPEPLTDRRLARAIEYMDAHLDRPLSMTEIGREAGVSVHHFGRLFQRRTGLQPHAYEPGRRISAACKLLEDGDLPIAEIARLCGYGHAAAFVAAFRRHLGTSPREHRTARRGSDPRRRSLEPSRNRD